MVDFSNLTHLSPAGSFNNFSSSGDDLSEIALTRGVNIGQLIAKTYLIVEAHANNKAHLKVDELEAHEKKLKNVTDFLTAIETQLSDNKGTVDLSHPSQRELVEEMSALLNSDKFPKDKTTWTREEADRLKTAFTRHSQILMQQVHHISSDVNREIERGTELLQIARKCLEMLHQLHQTFTSNQRGR
jgi:hypothetical protein